MQLDVLFCPPWLVNLDLGFDWPADPLINFTFSGLALATSQLGKQLSFDVPHGLPSCGQAGPFDT